MAQQTAAQGVVLLCVALSTGLHQVELAGLRPVYCLLAGCSGHVADHMHGSLDDHCEALYPVTGNLLMEARSDQVQPCSLLSGHPVRGPKP